MYKNKTTVYVIFSVRLRPIRFFYKYKIGAPALLKINRIRRTALA